MSGIKDFKKLKDVARKTKCKITINSKCGMPFIMNRYRKRKIFGIFLISIICLIFAQSRFVWNIQVEGINRISEEEIIEELKKAGLDTGTPKSKINTKEIINQIRYDRNDIAWMNIDLKRNECNS